MGGTDDHTEVAALSDEELVGKVCDEDQELYREVVRRYSAPLSRYIRTILRDHDLAKDALQETFVRAFVNLRGFDRERKFSSWIYRIARNEALDRLKGDRREVSLDGEGSVLSDTLPDDAPRPDEVADEALTTDAVRACVAKLPLMYREPVSLYHLEGRSYEEVADVLRLPMGTVATRIARAKRLLAVHCLHLYGRP
jgi:RNA polymerase sigma-70 factor (ECF subfamily)